MNPENWSERHKDFNSGLDADQVERRAILEGLASVEAGIEDERIAGVIDDELTEAGNSWEQRQEILESFTGRVAEEVSRRISVMKGAYPFTIQGGTLSYSRSVTGVYELCLAVSKNPTGVLEGALHASTVFEWIALNVLVAYFGNGARGFRTGWPPHVSENRGTRTKDTFEQLSSMCGEFQWNPRPDHPVDPTARLLKDCGLDIVVWKPWPDGRLASLFALGQCACGKNDVNARKGHDVSMARLGNWLRPISHVPPVRCLFSALHIPNNIQLYDLSSEAGLVFDRARLVLTAESSPETMKLPDAYDCHGLANLYSAQKAV